MHEKIRRDDARGHGEIVAGAGAPGGFASHETDTAHMGTDPRASVLNPHRLAHDVKNLFVVEGR
jgi:choline dehydrogenase-like flavoprotein